MYQKIYTFLFIILILLGGCNSGRSEKNNVASSGSGIINLKGTISISGAYALYPLASRLADGFMKIHPEVQITVSKTGTGQGIADLISHKSQVAMISRPLTDSEITAGVWVVPVAKDGVAPIISQKNPYLNKLLSMGLSTDEFKKVFTDEKPVTWGELLDTAVKEKVVTYTRQDESGAADIWAQFLYLNSSDLKGLKVAGDEEMIKAVSKDPFAMGFCNFSYAFDIKTGEKLKDIQIIPFDLNFDNKIKSREIPFSNLEKAHRSLWLGIYPKSLCRELTIGTIGKPKDLLVKEFIKYALTKGQADVKLVGLCELNNVYVRYSLEQLN